IWTLPPDRRTPVHPSHREAVPADRQLGAWTVPFLFADRPARAASRATFSVLTRTPLRFNAGRCDSTTTFTSLTAPTSIAARAGKKRWTRSSGTRWQFDNGFV